MLPAISAAFAAGLVGSPHCVGMCGPFAAACSGRGSHTAAWHLGKSTSYAGLGALGPATQTYVVDVVGRNRTQHAVTLNSTQFNAARALGPVLASRRESWTTRSLALSPSGSISNPSSMR